MGSRDVMDHNGVEFSLVQTIAPRGWRWRFEFLDNEYSGKCPTRASAIQEARRAIDNLLRLKPTILG
jgi:hypothetical protein